MKRWWNYQSRWGYSLAWQGRQPGFFSASNVTFENGGLLLKARQEEPSAELRKKGYHGYSTSFVRSKNSFTYGYVEIACKLGDSTISSSFWLKEVPRWVPPGKVVGRREREIDVFEYSTSKASKPWKDDQVKFANIFHTNTHWHYEWAQREKRVGHALERYRDCKVDLSQQGVVKVGILWGRDRICWYLNDELVREEKRDGRTEFNLQGHFQQFVGQDAPRMHIQFDRETMPGFFGVPTEDDKMHTHNGDFKIYYCRTWEM